MTVRELISALQAMPQDVPVLVGQAANDAYVSEASEVYVRGPNGSFDWSGPKYAGYVEIEAS